MIEFSEKHFGGYTIFTLVADEMPIRADEVRDYRYIIEHDPDTDCCTAKSRSYGAGSTRYYSFETLDQAFAHAIKWAKRKQSEAKKHNQ